MRHFSQPTATAMHAESGGAVVPEVLSPAELQRIIE
jgi:hypothetical protein